MSYREGRFWQPDVTVATVVVRDGRLLCVEERVNGALVINQPAGHLEPDESLADAALRETREETGLEVTTPLSDLGYVDYTRSKKRVHAFAGKAPEGATPRCASWEVDKAEFIEITRARRIIHPDQAALLDRLQQHLGATAVDPSAEKTSA